MSYDDDHEIHLLYFLMTQELGFRTRSFLMCDVSLDVLYILYIGFLFHIHVVMCLFDVLIALNVQKIEKK